MNKNKSKKTDSVVYNADRRMFLRSSLGYVVAIPFLPSLIAFEDRALAAFDETTIPGSAFFFYGINGYPHHRLLNLDNNNFGRFVKHARGSRSLALNDIVGSMPRMLQMLSPHFGDLAIHIGATYTNKNFTSGSGASHEPTDDGTAGLTRAKTAYHGPRLPPEAKGIDARAASIFRQRSDAAALRYDIVDLSDVFSGLPSSLVGFGYLNLIQLRV